MIPRQHTATNGKKKFWRVRSTQVGCGRYDSLAERRTLPAAAKSNLIVISQCNPPPKICLMAQFVDMRREVRQSNPFCWTIDTCSMDVSVDDKCCVAALLVVSCKSVHVECVCVGPCV